MNGFICFKVFADIVLLLVLLSLLLLSLLLLFFCISFFSFFFVLLVMPLTFFFPQQPRSVIINNFISHSLFSFQEAFSTILKMNSQKWLLFTKLTNWWWSRKRLKQQQTTSGRHKKEEEVVWWFSSLAFNFLLLFLSLNFLLCLSFQHMMHKVVKLLIIVVQGYNHVMDIWQRRY